MIPVAVPYIARNSSAYVNEALGDAAISGLFGRFLPEFERSFADYIGVEHAVSDFEETLALPRQRHLLLVPVEQQNVIFILQLAHLVGDCRLRQEQRFRRA